MAKIRYHADGRHSFIGVPDLPFKYLQWCPHCRDFLGSTFVKRHVFHDRNAVYRMKCGHCQMLYEVALVAGQKVRTLPEVVPGRRVTQPAIPTVVHKRELVNGYYVRWTEKLLGER